MPKSKAPPVPDTRTLKHLLEEYLEMMHEAEKIVKKALALNSEKEEFWDHISEHAADISMLGIRSNTIVEEIDELIDQLPEG
jgi:predicted transcriptional regulator